MILPSKGYITFKTDSWDEWVSAINSDHKYCKSISDIFEFKGKCNALDLPSWHPYWTHIVRLGGNNLHLRRIESMKEYVASWGSTTTHKANLRATIERTQTHIEQYEWYGCGAPVIESLSINLYK